MIKKAVNSTNSWFVITIVLGIITVPLDLIWHRPTIFSRIWDLFFGQGWVNAGIVVLLVGLMWLLIFGVTLGLYGVKAKLDALDFKG